MLASFKVGLVTMSSEAGLRVVFSSDNLLAMSFLVELVVVSCVVHMVLESSVFVCGIGAVMSSCG